MPTFRAPAILFLKATTTTTITVPGYTRKDGTFVPPHQKVVHINPDKSKAEVLSGKGSHSQKVAHSKLTKLPGWASMTEDEQHAHILSWATNYQQKQSAAAAVSGWKAAVMAGKVPTKSQQDAFDALDQAKKDALLADVGAQPEPVAEAVADAKKAAGVKDSAPVSVSSVKMVKDPLEGTTHVVTFSNGATVSMVKLNSSESMGLPGWHDASKTSGAVGSSYLADTKDEAISWLLVKQQEASGGPKEGDTKPGADGGTLVLKDGHWVKQGGGEPAQQSGAQVAEAAGGSDAGAQDDAIEPLDLSTVSSWSVLKKQKEDDPTKVFQMAEAWLAANPTKADDLSSTLVDLGFLGVAKVMGIYKPPSAGLKSSTPADHAKADAENEAAAAQIDALVSGTGGHYPVKAAKAITAKLKDDPEFLASWSAITHVQRLQIIVDLAKEYQAAASASAAVSGWKKAAHAGKNPSPAQWKAFYALPAGKKAEMLSAVHAAAGGTDHLKAPAVAKDEPAPAPASQAAATPVTLSPSQEAAIVDALKLNGGEMPGAGTGVGYYASIWDSLSPEKQADLKAKASPAPAKPQAPEGYSNNVYAKWIENALDAGLPEQIDAYIDALKNPAEGDHEGAVLLKYAQDAKAYLTGEPVQASAPAHRLTGNKYTKQGEHWVNSQGKQFGPGSWRHTALSVLNGDPVDEAVPYGARQVALDALMDAEHGGHGLSPGKVLNALYPPHHAGLQEGDTKTINGATYVLKGGRWHKVVAADEHGEVPPVLVPVDEKSSASLNGEQHEFKDGAWLDASGSAVPQMYALALNLIAGKEIDPEVAAKNNGMMSNGKLFAAKMAVAEGVSPVVALNALFPRSGENAPKDGHKKTIDGVDYVMKDGTWHDPKDIDETWLPPDLKSAIDYFFEEKDTYNLQWAVDNGTPAQASYAKQKLAEMQSAAPEEASPGGVDAQWDVFHNTEPGHNKFWAVSVVGDYMITHYGKIGTAGTTTMKHFPKPGAALAQASKLQKQKEAKGYAFQGMQQYPVPGDAKPAPKPASATVKQKPAIETADGWLQTGPQGGSNPGGRFKDPSGQEWYIKLPASEAHAKNELLAAKLYEAAGVKVPELKLVTKDGKVGIASKWVDGMSKAGHPDELAMADGALSGFAVDAWLANWDVTGLGLDNLLLGPDGKAVRIDVGGSLLFRAQGEPKGDAFGADVTELESLLDPKKNGMSAALFSGMSKAAQERSAERVLKISDAQIFDLVNQFGPGGAHDRADLIKRLIARKGAIAAAFPEAKGAAGPAPAKPKLDPTALPVNPNDLPPYHDFHNWNGPGKGLSSKQHINDANLKAEKALHDFALKGNLVALKDYHFEAIDKETGASLGMKPIAEHPSQHVKLYHSDLVQYLDAIANPPEPLRVTEGNDPTQFKAEKLGKTISSVQANKKLGFWVALGKLAKAEPFVKYFFGKEKPVSSAYKTQVKAKGIDHMPKLAQRLIHRVQSSGSYNDYFRDGHDSDGDGYSTAAIAEAAYAAATEKPAGTTIYRWQNMPESMVKQILATDPGLVFQNPGSMCTSMHPTATSGFGQHRMVIHFAEGAKAVDSFASGSFTGEQEITTLMGQRFMLLHSEMSNNLGGIGKKGLEIHVLMLPPDPDYVADLQQRAATTTLKKSHRAFNELMGIAA